MKFKIQSLTILILLFALAWTAAGELFACDTWVALANATKKGYIIFGKNSDRPLFDCQPLMFYPRKKWPEGSKIDLGRLTIPQAEITYANMGSSPYWCWGYEEGINEYGVVIGNEGIWTKALAENIEAAKKGKGPPLGPTGMDLIRLALERSQTAKQALEVIIGMVEKYGQFGSGVPTQGAAGAYDNSFIIADPKEAWVLETTGKQWIARKFTKGVTSISNKLSITTEWERISPGLIDRALKKEWWPEDKAQSFNFEMAYSDISPTQKARSKRAQIRADCSLGLLKEKEGQITLSWMKRIARDRSSNPGIDLDQTASSCVAVLPESPGALPVFWWCAATPSSSCFIPFFVHGSELPEIVSTAATAGKKVTPPRSAYIDTFSKNSFWWLFRDLCDKVNVDWDTRNPIVRAEFDTLEMEFASGIPDLLKKAVQLRKAGKTEEAAKLLDDYSAGCVEKAVKKINDLRKQFEPPSEPIPDKYRPYAGTYIANFGRYRNAEFKILVKDGKLAVDIPGQRTVTVKEPDEESRWYFTITNRIAISFVKDTNDGITAMKFHEASRLRKKQNPEDKISADADVPEKVKGFLGTYPVPGGRSEYSIIFKNENLALAIPGRDPIDLKPPDEKGRWHFANDPDTCITFVRNKSDKVTALNIIQTFVLTKKG
jgi:secernin